jgi:hypothetical protein
MPITYSWLREDTNIIVVRFLGNWTVDEQVNNYELLQMMRETSGRFDMIVDFSDASYTPAVGSLGQWITELEARTKTYPNWALGGVQVITSNVMIAYFDEGVRVSEVIRKHCRRARTLEEAVQVVRADRVSVEQARS